MYETNNELVRKADGCELYRPWSMFSEPEIQEAAMLFKFKPPAHPQIEVALRVRFELEALPNGGHQLAPVFRISGQETRDGSRSYTGLATDVPVDKAVVDRALAEGKNPVLEILVEQANLREEFCEGSTALRAIVDQAVADRAAAPGKPAQVREDGSLPGRL